MLCVTGVYLRDFYEHELFNSALECESSGHLLFLGFCFVLLLVGW